MTFKRLLLIDDNDDYTTLVEFFLQQDTDWEIIIALNGKEGIAEARQKQPDLILLDIVMPNLDGISVYKILKSQRATSSIPIIFLTAMMGVEEMVRSQVNADVEVITKPMDLTVLKNLISDLYNRYLALT